MRKLLFLYIFVFSYKVFASNTIPSTKVVPYNNNHHNGFKVERIDEENLLYKMGLRENDIIIKLNKMPLEEDIGTASFLEFLINFEHKGIEFEVLRNQENIIITYKLRDYTFDKNIYNRKEKTFDLVVSPLGIKSYTGYPYGFTLGYYLSQNNVIEIDYNKGAGLNWSYSTEVKEKSFILRLKHFWGNSFYTNTGLGTRTITLEGHDSDPDTYEKKYSFNLQYKATVLDLAIGNKWQWDYFTMGADWLGFLIPINTSYSKNFSDGATNEDEKIIEKRFDDVEKDFSVYFVRFYLGFSF